MVRKAEADFEGVKHDPHLRKEALFRLRQAQAALHFYEERARKEMRAIIHFVRKWGHGKQESRPGWLQALHVITCKGSSKSSGSIEFYAFPQEIVNQMVERTGGRPVVVAAPNVCDGEVEIDPEGRIFLVDQFSNGDGQFHERLIFLMQVTENGEVLMDRDRSGNPVRIERIRPFPIQAGRSTIVNGKVAFPETLQRPFVPPNLTA